MSYDDQTINDSGEPSGLGGGIVDDNATPQDTENAASQEIGEGTETQQAAPEWNPQEWGYKFQGQMIYPKSREALLNDAQFGRKYQIESQRIAEKQRQLEQMDQQYAKYKQLEESFNGNPEFAQAVYNLKTQFENGTYGQEQDQQAQAYLSEITALKDELNGIKSRQQEWDNAQADRALQEEIDDLKSTYQTHDWDADDGEGSLITQVMKHALDNNFPNLKAAYKDMFFDNVAVETKAAALRAEQEKRARAKKEGVLDDSGQAAPSGQQRPDFKRMTYEDAGKAALASIRKG